MDKYDNFLQIVKCFLIIIYARLSKEEQDVLDYYQQIEKTKYVNWHIKRYCQYLKFKGIGKRALKEVLLFHFPVLGYMLFAIM